MKLGKFFLRYEGSSYTEFDKALYKEVADVFKIVNFKNRSELFLYPENFLIGGERHFQALKSEKEADIVLEFKLSDRVRRSNGVVYFCVPGQEVVNPTSMNALNFSHINRKYDLIIADSKEKFLILNKYIKNNTKVILCDHMLSPESKGFSRFIKIAKIFAVNGRRGILNSFLRIGTSDSDINRYALIHGYYSLFGVIRRGFLGKFLQRNYSEIVKPKIIKLLTTVFHLFPIEKKTVVFRTFQQTYCCNPKYISKRLSEISEDCKIVWIVNLKKIDKKDFPKRIRLIQQNSFRAWYYMCTAHILVDNNVRKTMPRKKQEQIYIQTWHGALGIKKFTNVWDQGTQKLADKTTDLLISNSKFETFVYRESVWPTAEIVEWGHPRNDIFFYDKERKERIIDNVYKYYGIDKKLSIILYAPTFRDEHLYGTAKQKKDVSMYLEEFDKLISCCERKFNREFVVLTRLHPHIAKNLNLSDSNYVYNASAYPDIQELMLAASIAITDYSSWIYDFLLLKRPGFLYATDSVDYLKQRELYFPLNSTPFPLAENMQELMENIQNFNFECFSLAVDDFLNKAKCTDRGGASNQVAKFILDKINSV